jgi:hypothetical protein
MSTAGKAACAAAACFVLALSTEASAQAPAQPPDAMPPPPPAMPEGGARTHDGFYLQLGAGVGYLHSSGPASYYPPSPSYRVSYDGVTLPSLHLFVGGSPVKGWALAYGFMLDSTVSPRVTVAGQSRTTTGSVYLFSLGFLADIYPNPHQGLHFQGFVGYGGLRFQDGEGATGPSLAVGVGYEFWVAKDWSIGPLFRFTYAPLFSGNSLYRTICPALLASVTYY